MKKSSIALKSLFALMAFLNLPTSSLLASDQKIEEVLAPVTHVFVPRGFDSNDDSEIVIAGYLPSLCYKSPRAFAQVEGKRADINVTALKTSGRLCAQMSVPFLEVAPLGVLGTGSYDLRVNMNHRRGVQTQLAVVSSRRSTIDENIYANVSQIERIRGTRAVLLKGENPSSCYQLDTIHMISNGKDVYSVLPILKQVSSPCTQSMTPFEYEFNVPEEFQISELLLHVRVMNGKSINHLFDNR
jgi:hypothetical protein